MKTKEGKLFPSWHSGSFIFHSLYGIFSKTTPNDLFVKPYNSTFSIHCTDTKKNVKIYFIDEVEKVLFIDKRKFAYFNDCVLPSLPSGIW